MYSYSGKDIARFLKTAGYPDSSGYYSYHISRNSEGTELRFVHPNGDRDFMITCDGSLKKVVWPGYPTWFNDQQQVVAWHAGLVYYAYGSSEPIACAFGPNEGPDPAGKFFVKTPNPACPDRPASKDWWKRTEIYSIEKPYQPLATVPVCGLGWKQIFFKDNKIFLFGGTCEPIKDVIVLHTLQVEGETLKEIETITIRKPHGSDDLVNIEDFSPWSDEVLLVDEYDFPERSVYYVFNLRTHEMKKLGKEPFRGGWGFFLQCDILQEATEKLKKQQRNE